MLSKDAIASQFKKHLDLSKGKLGKQYANTKKCQSFYAGDFMSYKDSVEYVDNAGAKKKTLVKFNKVKPYVNAVKGFMAQNRRRPKYEARIENGKMQELFSQYANAIADYVRNNANADQIETQQDGDMLTCGYGAIETALSYGDGYVSSDVDGEILMGRLDPLSVGWDPSARAPNLLDARYVYYCKEYPVEDAERLFEGFVEGEAEESDDAQEGEATFFPNGGAYDKITEYDFADKEEKRIKVFFYQWAEIETFFKLANPLYQIQDADAVMFADVWMQTIKTETGAEFDTRAEVLSLDAETVKKFKEYFGDYMTEPFEFKRKVYYSAVVSGKRVFSAYKSSSQQGFSIQFKTGDYDAANNMWMGMVNSMMEPALYFNKALTELMFTIAANSKGGVMYESNAVDDIAEFEANYAKTDGNVEVNDGALSGGKIKPKATPTVPTGLDGIIALADNAMRDVNGFDPTFMGSREFANDTATFQRQRIKQVMSTLACYFDSASLYQKSNARILLDYMRVFVENNENLTIRVAGEEGRAMFLRLSSGQISAEYDVVVGEAPLTQQDKQEQSAILMGMADKLMMTDPAAAKVLYGMAVELMPLDPSLKERAKEVFNPDQNAIDPAYVKQLEGMVKELQGAASKATLDNIAANTAKSLADAEKAKAAVAETKAKTVKTLQEAKQRDLENGLVDRATNINVSI